MSLRDLEHDSIRAFVEANAHLLTGRVLDFGSGRQSYRSIVEEAGGDYVPYDRFEFPGSVIGTDVGPDDPLVERWDAILATQVIQYLPDALPFLCEAEQALEGGGSLVMTGPTNWPVLEMADLSRLTVTGITALLAQAGFVKVTVEPRAHVVFEGEKWSLGWGAVATT